MTSLYWCSVSVLAHLTNDIASVLVWLSRSLSLHKESGSRNQEGEIIRRRGFKGSRMNGINEMNRRAGKREERKEERMSIHQYSNAAPVTPTSYVSFPRQTQQEVLVRHCFLKVRT